MKHPAYKRIFNININPTKKISYGKGRICPYCGATKEFIIKRGHRKIKRDKNTQLFYCYWCERRFSLGGDMFRMRNKRQVIEKALSLRQKGFTLREIEIQLNKQVSHIAIWRWIKRWEKKINKE